MAFLRSLNRAFLGAMLVGAGAGAALAQQAAEVFSPRTLDIGVATCLLVGLVLTHGLTKPKSDYRATGDRPVGG